MRKNSEILFLDTLCFGGLASMVIGSGLCVGAAVAHVACRSGEPNVPSLSNRLLARGVPALTGGAISLSTGLRLASRSAG